MGLEVGAQRPCERHAPMTGVALRRHGARHGIPASLDADHPPFEVDVLPPQGAQLPGPDGFAGGWKLGGVRVWCRGQLACDRGDIDLWLEDDERVWSGCEAESTLVNRTCV